MKNNGLSIIDSLTPTLSRQEREFMRQPWAVGLGFVPLLK